MSDVTFGIMVGFPRSGTTLLRRILDGHPDISCPPEPWLTTACARFLAETEVEGPPIGVRTGLGFSDIDESEIFGELRSLILHFHSRMAAGKKVMVEKSGFDIFHMETLEKLLGPNTAWIGILRDPLDTLASNLALADRLGRFLPELTPWLARHVSPIEGLAAAWADRVPALVRTLEEKGNRGCLLRYEDLVREPEATLAPLFDLLGVTPLDAEGIARALAVDSRVGLGDWIAAAAREVETGSLGRGRRTLSRQARARCHSVLKEAAGAMGYALPPLPAVPDRSAAIRQVRVAARLERGPGPDDDH